MRQTNHDFANGKEIEKNSSVVESYKRHKKLERQVESAAQYAKYSTSAALRHRELKKMKLQEMDRIMSAISGKEE